MAQSTEQPLCAKPLDRGGYKVQPVPAPPSIQEDKITKINAGNINQNERLFIRGNAMSGTPMYKGINQLPKPEIKVGIRKKKIITIACAVVITLNEWLSIVKLLQDKVSSKRIYIDIAVLISLAKILYNIYNVLISL
jgi:hypothetical protein